VQEQFLDGECAGEPISSYGILVDEMPMCQDNVQMRCPEGGTGDVMLRAFPPGTCYHTYIICTVHHAFIYGYIRVMYGYICVMCGYIRVIYVICTVTYVLCTCYVRVMYVLCTCYARVMYGYIRVCIVMHVLCIVMHVQYTVIYVLCTCYIRLHVYYAQLCTCYIR
jgi:hypothetical protein